MSRSRSYTRSQRKRFINLVKRFNQENRFLNADPLRDAGNRATHNHKKLHNNSLDSLAIRVIRQIQQ